ncbi:nitroreductase/quinone reductase family protein [Solwaraspora sp. WMMD791]|uniref:nitroreductase/quinone reductase family protein n=1 Tax=Solwaraspora sp. WMMD791 TaxID=3016086 RepID=UPI00249A90BE|nr:nitroreductase/quinone reductase family protein [Solwaraspora sp. WMMD791]WFE26693.1 nitroreductase/quinone reductase family protein [Solwaraspora sp. WMMD791]
MGQQGQRRPLLARVAARFNRHVLRLRSSRRWGRLVQRRITVVTYTGRRSGRTFSTPVSYRRAGDTVTISVKLPDVKNWWRNFTGDGGPISLHFDGVEHPGHAVARRDDRGRVTVTVALDS